MFTRGGSYNFQPSFRGGSVSFVQKGGGGPCVLHPPHFQMLRFPYSPPLYFLTSPLFPKIFAFTCNRLVQIADLRRSVLL